MKLRTVLSASMALAITAAVFAQEKKLSVGDTAPGLDVEKWVKKSETTLESGKVYVIEFWATWCGPCIKSIPHLTELQKEYADEGLTIIGVNFQEEAAKVEKFVRTKGDKMDYTVVVDRSDGTKRAWFDAAGLQGIPAAFLVDRKGKIAYIGHPADEAFQEALKKVLSGRFDPKLEKQAAPMLSEARTAKKMKNWRLASKVYDEVIKLDPSVFASVGLEKFKMMLVDMDNKASAYEYARNSLLGEQFASDAGALQMLAETIVKDPTIEQPKRDMDLALESAEAARRVANNDAESLATAAMVRYHRGEIAQAIDLQKQAYFNAAPKHKADFKRVLSTYSGAGDRASSLGK